MRHTENNLDNTINELFPKDFKQVKESITEIDKMSEGIPLFEPSLKCREDIKNRIAIEIQQEQRHKSHFVKVGLIAAMVLICFALSSLLLLDSQPRNNEFDYSAYKTALYSDDNDATLSNEIESLEYELNDENFNSNSNFSNRVSQIETEFNQLTTDLWKG